MSFKIGFTAKNEPKNIDTTREQQVIPTTQATAKRNS